MLPKRQFDLELMGRLARDLWSDEETIRWPGSRIVLSAYRLAGGPGRNRIARFAAEIMFRFEGRKCASRSVRQMLLEDYGIVNGAWTAGETLLPGLFPPNLAVGRFCSIAHGVRIASLNHPLGRISTSGVFYATELGLVERRGLGPDPLRIIGHDVWIGENAIVTPGCARIWHGAVVGAGAVVTRDVPPFAVVAGNPARILRYRFPPALRSRIIESRWWYRSGPELVRDLRFWQSDLEGTGDLPVLAQGFGGPPRLLEELLGPVPPDPTA
jgi:acetyltransferase-like isoleucine patch superfamily enzyme